jgi:hypothetical protein
LTVEDTFRGRLRMGAAAVSYGRGDDQRQAMFQSALVATLQTAAAAAELSWERWIWERVARSQAR